MGDVIIMVTYSCGCVVDVNKLLLAQRMRLKKQLIRSLENEIRSVIMC